jgi:nicotinamidase-related amidase
VIEVDLRVAPPAVLVVDMQAVFIAPDGPFANDTAGPLVERLNAFLDGCRAAGAPVLFCHYLLAADLSDAGLLRGNPGAAHFATGAPFAGLDPRVRREPDEPEIPHHRPGCFHESGLEAALARLGTGSLLLTGCSVNNAISTTAREAFARDIPALVVRDCVDAAPWEPAELLGAYLDALATWTAEVAPAAGVLDRLRDAQA